MASTLGFEPEPHWWEVNDLTTDTTHAHHGLNYFRIVDCTYIVVNEVQLVSRCDSHHSTSLFG